MFSSNQRFEVSCTHEQLPKVLKLVLDMQDTHKHLAYQTTADGRLVLGWYSAQHGPESGWTPLMFEDPSIDWLAETAIQHCKAHKATASSTRFDGGYSQGCLVRSVRETLADEDNGIKCPFFAICSIQPFELFYSK